MLPVPLNSSKITSSMRLPVSTSAVARMVRLPPFSMLRRGAEKPLRPLERVGVQTAGKHFAARRGDGVVSTGQTGDAVQEDDDVLFVFHQPLGLFAHHFCHLHVSLRPVRQMSS